LQKSRGAKSLPVENYASKGSKKTQACLRKLGQNGNSCFYDGIGQPLTNNKPQMSIALRLKKTALEISSNSSSSVRKHTK
jgi:hypothetical protein